MSALIGIDDWTKKDKAAFLANWKTRRHELHEFSESLLDDLLVREVNGECRKSCIEAIHSRFCLVRKNRERKALLERAKQKKEQDRAARTVGGDVPDPASRRKGRVLRETVGGKRNS